MSDGSSTTAVSQSGVPRTVAEALGQIAWLLTQSSAHRELKLRVLEEIFLPPITLEQFRIFRFGALPDAPSAEAVDLSKLTAAKEVMEQLPLGVAIWAHLSKAAEAKVEKGQALTRDEWRSGDQTWLVELISPFATPENKLSQAMLLDLMEGPFRDRVFHLHRTDAQGRREKVTVSSHVQSR